MQQFVIQKRNRVGEHSWTTRVLTVDQQHGILYLSKRRGATELNHHCMLTIKEVSVWPMYNWLSHPTSFFLGDVQRTLCVRGSTITLGESSIVNRVFHPRTRKVTVAEKLSLEASQQQLSQGEGSSGLDSVQTPDDVYRDDVWLLRCMTDADMAVVVETLKNTVGDDERVKMWAPRDAS